MIAVLESSCTLKDKAAIVRTVEAEGFRVQVSEAEGRSLVGVVGAGAARMEAVLRGLPGVAEVRTSAPPWPLVSRENRSHPTRVRLGDALVGGEEVVVIAGPCSVENREQMLTTADYTARYGARALRGGAFKPRTSPYSFQGLGEEGLRLLAEARERTGLPVVTEVVAPEDVPLVARYADVLQIGARNMQNFRLLTAVGQQSKPVLLKRGMMATLQELLLAAEYVVSAGNPRVMLCERGIRTYERATRNTLDVGAIPWLKERTHLPVVADPSHACGIRSLVTPLALAAVAAGADALIVETHPNPELALSDKDQALLPGDFAALMESVRKVAAAVGRRVPAEAPV